jgi:hypothetical protein
VIFPARCRRSVRWFAKIERLDGRPIKRVGVVGAKESIATPAARYSADDAIDLAYRSVRSPDWLKMKNPNAPAVTREAKEDWGKERWR